MHLAKVRHDARECNIVKAWDLIRDINNNFSKVITIKDLDPQSVIDLSLLVPRKTRYSRSTRPSPEKTFRNYLGSLLSEDAKQVENLTKYISHDFVKADSYIRAINERLKREADNPFIGIYDMTSRVVSIILLTLTICLCGCEDKYYNNYDEQERVIIDGHEYIWTITPSGYGEYVHSLDCNNRSHYYYSNYYVR